MKLREFPSFEKSGFGFFILGGVVEAAAALQEVADFDGFEIAGEFFADVIEGGVGLVVLLLETLGAGDLGEELEVIIAVARGAGGGEDFAEALFGFYGLVVVPEGVEIG